MLKVSIQHVNTTFQAIEIYVKSKFDPMEK